MTIRGTTEFEQIVYGDHDALAAISVITTLGDLAIGGAAGVVTRLPGNITTTKKVLTQTGTGTVSAAPAWGTLTYADVGAAPAAGSTSILTLGAIGTCTSFVTQGTITCTEALCTANVGAVAGLGVTATEYGEGTIHRTRINLVTVTVPLVDEAGVVAYGSLKIYDFPEGAILLLGAITDLDVTKSSAGVSDTWDGDIALGSVAAANDADLTGTEADIMAKSATPQATAGATTANSANAALTLLDGTTAAKDCFVNLLVDDADHDVTGTPCNLVLNGTITLVWIKLGDY